MSTESGLLEAWCSFYAGSFVWNVKKEMGVVLDYSRATLNTAEKFFLKRLWRRTLAVGKIPLFAAATAYLVQVVIRNFGGEAAYDRETGILLVENVGNLKVVTMPELEVHHLHVSRKPGMFEQYYDLISLALDVARRESIEDELLKGEETVLKPSAEAYVLLAKKSPEKLRLRPAISLFYWCPVCNKAGCAETYSTRLQRKRLFHFWLELFLNILKKTRERTCLKCGRPVLPFGYSIGFTANVIVVEKGGVFFLKENKKFEEGLVTGYSMVLGKSLFTARRLHKDAKKRIIDIGEPKTVSRTLITFFPKLPEAVFCV